MNFAEAFNVANRPNYISAPQGKIYINGILIDECYDLQYMYQEMKQPIYGYKSKFYDAILPGQVVVSGSFSINYIHDAYLLKVLDKSQSDLSSSSSVNRSLDKKAELELAAKQYKDNLIALKKLNDEVKVSKTKAKESTVKLDQLRNSLYSTTKDFDDWNKLQLGELDRLQVSYELSANGLTSAQQGALETLSRWLHNPQEWNGELANTLLADSAVSNVFEQYKNIKKARDNYIYEKSIKEKEVSDAKQLVDQGAASKRAVDQEIAANTTTASNLTRDITTLKAQTQSINEQIVRELATDESGLANSRYRAEGGGSFTIMIEYNGKIHKIITGVELLGHQHVLGQAGQPVQEVYKFVAQNIE